MKRTIEPEELDTLEENDPLAVRIHRDIDAYNRLLGSYEWFARSLARRVEPDDSVLEIAAGTGRLIAQLLRQQAIPQDCPIAAIDAHCSCPAGLHSRVSWQRKPIETANAPAQATIVLVNLFLHQLTDAALARLGGRVQNSDVRLILAAEPLRASWAIPLCRGTRAAGFCGPSVEDGVKSIRAGFRSGELAQLLRLDPAIWKICDGEGFPGWLRFTAIRK